MLHFAARFFYNNIYIAVIVCIILAAKKILKGHLSERLQYNLWFLLLFLLGIPLLPSRLPGFLQIFTRIFSSGGTSVRLSADDGQIFAKGTQTTAMDLINDFSVSVNHKAASVSCSIFLGVWFAGIAIMVLVTLRARLRLYQIEKSSLPLQNPAIHELFAACRSEMGIQKNIPVYTTAYLNSPIMTGIIHPHIYLPLHLVSDFNRDKGLQNLHLGMSGSRDKSSQALRYMLLHELQHYKHKDSLVNCAASLFRIIYWFNPAVRRGLREMQNDREIACDSSVLKMLNKAEYKDYGNTLINFAEKLSRPAFPFVSGMGGDMRQIKRRILNIVSYRPLTFGRKFKGIVIYCLIAALLLGLAPVLFAYASEENTYQMQTNGQVSFVDLSSYFEGCQGSFVLYDTSSDSWQIYNEPLARQRISPDSTYKIFSALAALEMQYIQPDSSNLSWDGQVWPFAEWNQDQTLTTALQNSVNWYFQTLDEHIGLNALTKFYSDIEYGNHDLSGGVSEFWAESSLKISPLEQVELLKKLHTNEFHFQDKNVQAVKDALRISSSGKGVLYGKTGTGNVDGEYVNGWFIGYVESADATYFFAVNIQKNPSSGSDAEEEIIPTGAAASEIALSILQDKTIY